LLAHEAFSPSSSGWTRFAFNFTASGNDLLTIGVIGQPTTSWNVDNLSVTAAPEPATWAMMLVGFAGLGCSAHRRARKAIPSLA
jgi:hypothetical protein